MPQKTLITSNGKQGRQILDLVGAALDSTGLLPDEGQYIIRNGGLFQQEQRKLLERFAVGCPVSVTAAQNLLGVNFFGVEDWQEHYGVSFTKSQLARVSQVPWSEKVLAAPCPFYSGQQMKHTHVAFLGVEQHGKQPLTIRQWQELHPASGQPRFNSYPPNCWYTEEQFATEVTCQLRWYLMLKEIVPGSENKTLDEQQPMLPPEYEVPTGVAEVTKHLLHFKKTGVCLNLNRYGRVQDTTADGRRVVVGYFGTQGLLVYSSWDGCHWDGVGLAASRKLGA